MFGASFLPRRPFKTVFQIRIQLNPDPGPAKNFNPDPGDLESGSKLFLNTIWQKNKKLLNNCKIFSSKEVNWEVECCTSHQKVKLCCNYLLFKIFYFF